VKVRLPAPAQRVTILCALGLVVAGVCFGLLQSSGEVKQPALSLGGAFVGFLITVTTLNRFWQQEESQVEADAKRSDSDFLYEQIVKLLDFRSANVTPGTQTVMLNDYYRIRRLGKASVVAFHYATTGRIEPEGQSVTHPETAAWSEGKVTHLGGDGKKLKHEYTMKIDLREVAENQAVPVVSQIAYRDAFTGAKSEWLETHIEYPTARLGMLIIFPADRRCLTAVAEVQIGRNDWRLLPEHPLIFQQDTVIYWSIDNPTLSARYMVKWDWAPRTVMAAPLSPSVTP
jgi:hypothetical protein